MSDSLRIVVIDDELDLARVLALAAMDAGHSVVATSDAARLLGEICIGVDVAVLDLCMPGVDGVALLHALASAPRPPRVVLMSGLDEGMLEATRSLAEQLGLEVSDVLRKPFGLEAFRASLGRTSTRRRSFPATCAGASLDVADVACALAEDRVELLFQPQVELSTRRVVGAEALLRIRRADGALVLPDAFLPAARRGGLMNELSRRVVLLACCALEEIVRFAPTFAVSVNVPPSALGSRGFVAWVRGALERAGLAGRHLTMEITEDERVCDDVPTLRALLDLRLAGVRVSIDDFGAGHSTLVQAHKVPANELKIDRSFIAGLTQSSHAEALVRNVVRLGADLRMRVVAEGVEDEATVAVLRRLGCAIAQGYYFGHPMPVGSLLERLGARPTLPPVLAAV